MAKRIFHVIRLFLFTLNGFTALVQKEESHKELQVAEHWGGNLKVSSKIYVSFYASFLCRMWFQSEQNSIVPDQKLQ